MDQQDVIFALDVGTRSVVGLVVQRVGAGYRIKAAETEEHRQRAMMDGQIHDIPMVAQVVGRIKAKLEKRLGTTLHQVAVAAAGRTLQTARGTAERDVSVLEEVTPEDVFSLQLEAVQEARKKIQDKSDDLHCVGYSVVTSKLDDTLIGNLVGQRGAKMEIEAIATFLPRVVVDSLQAVLQRCGLEMHSLTLEPIAAINVAIPPNMRQLNLVLVDVGAGTSDIAVTADGSVTGYGMVPSAGDEITEEICSRLLVDFATGEIVKRQLNERDTVEFMDVLGAKQQVQSREVIETIMPVVDELARQVAERIIELNGKPPQAVICIGGGSLTPGFTARLAAALSLTENRVAVRGREVIQDVTGGPRSLSGPQAITPIGISVTSLEQKSMGNTSVWVNDRQVRLLNIKKASVADALLASGINARRLHGRPGPALSVEVNNRLLFLRGTAGKPAVIKVNGAIATVETLIAEEDRIEIQPAEDGLPGGGNIASVVPEMKAKTLIVNGRPIRLEPYVTMNDKPVNRDTLLVDSAIVRYRVYQTVAEVLAYLGLTADDSSRVLVNCVEVDVNEQTNDGDNILLEKKPEVITITLNGDPFALPAEYGSGLILSDLFRFVDVNINEATKKKKLAMAVNGNNASFTTPIVQGDSIDLKWE